MSVSGVSLLLSVRGLGDRAFHKRLYFRKLSRDPGWRPRGGKSPGMITPFPGTRRADSGRLGLGFPGGAAQTADFLQFPAGLPSRGEVTGGQVTSRTEQPG